MTAPTPGQAPEGAFWGWIDAYVDEPHLHSYDVPDMQRAFEGGWQAAPELAAPVTVAGALCRDYPSVVAAMQAEIDRERTRRLHLEAERDRHRGRLAMLLADTPFEFRPDWAGEYEGTGTGDRVAAVPAEEDDAGGAVTVAALFHVAPETVRRWALSGRLPGARTPGGQRRFAESAVLALLAEQTTEGAS